MPSPARPGRRKLPRWEETRLVCAACFILPCSPDSPTTNRPQENAHRDELGCTRRRKKASDKCLYRALLAARSCSTGRRTGQSFQWICKRRAPPDRVSKQRRPGPKGWHTSSSTNGENARASLAGSVRALRLSRRIEVQFRGRLTADVQRNIGGPGPIPGAHIHLTRSRPTKCAVS